MQRNALTVRRRRSTFPIAPASRDTAAATNDRDRDALHRHRVAATADRSLHQPVDIGDVDAVAPDLRPIDVDRQAWLTELLHHRHVLHARDLVEDAFHGAALLLEHREVTSEHFHVEGALETRLRLIDRVLGRLRIVERDARKHLELVGHRVDELLAGDTRHATRRTVWPDKTRH